MMGSQVKALRRRDRERVDGKSEEEQHLAAIEIEEKRTE